MDEFITNESLFDTFAYLDDITICGHDQAYHDKNFKNFEKGEIQPDPDRPKPLQQLQPPTDSESLKRIHGMFSDYSQWIKNFLKKIRPLISTKQSPLNEDALNAFELLKSDVE